jgi:hypothetical protein
MQMQSRKFTSIYINIDLDFLSLLTNYLHFIYYFSIKLIINCLQTENVEPNDLDTIYKVLKKAGEMSAAAEKSTASGTAQPMDIPTVNINVPDYPDREHHISTGTGARGPLKSQGPTYATKQGLSAPTMDVSCSGPRYFLLEHQKFDSFYFWLFSFSLHTSITTLPPNNTI